MQGSRPHLVGLLAGAALAVSLVLAALLITKAWTHISESQLISVTGAARRNVRSDLAIWRASFSADADSLLLAHKKLNEDSGKVDAFLRSNGLRNFAFLPVSIREITTRSDSDGETVPVTVGYRLTRSIEVRSTDVDALPKLSSDATSLLEQNVAFASQGIEFIYTNAGDAKIEMMADATKDARARAEQIAIQGGRSIKGLRSAKMGVIQINPLYSTATSWEGNNDVSAVEKTITATITATFEMK